MQSYFNLYPYKSVGVDWDNSAQDYTAQLFHSSHLYEQPASKKTLRIKDGFPKIA